MRIDLFSYLLFSIMLLASCSVKDTEQAAPLTPFFDLDGFINAEVERLSSETNIVDKTIVLDGETESKRLNDLKMAEELKLLRNSDINRSAWLDRYQVDSTFENGQLLSINYTALDEDLRTRSMEINFKEGSQVSKVHVHNLSKTLLSSGETTISYQPSLGLTLESHQEVVGSKSTELKVELRFVE